MLCRLLDRDRGGYLHIAPTEPVRRRRRRCHNRSTVLETTVITDHGELIIIDAIPLTNSARHAMLDGLWGGHG